MSIIFDFRFITEKPYRDQIFWIICNSKLTNGITHPIYICFLVVRLVRGYFNSKYCFPPCFTWPANLWSSIAFICSISSVSSVQQNKWTHLVNVTVNLFYHNSVINFTCSNALIFSFPWFSSCFLLAISYLMGFVLQAYRCPGLYTALLWLLRTACLEVPLSGSSEPGQNLGQSVCRADLLSGLGCHMASPLGTGRLWETVSAIFHAKSISANVFCTKHK